MKNVQAMALILAMLGSSTAFAQEIVRQSDTVLILGLATTIATIFSAAVGGVVAVLVARLNSKATAAALADVIVAKKAQEAAEKAEEVRKSLQVNRVSTDTKLHEIKTLVNGGVEKTLRLAAVAMRRLATNTNNAGDIEAARVAEELLAEHVAAQLVVDKAHAKAVATVQPNSSGEAIGIGAAVGEIGVDVKEVKEDVKKLSASSKE